MSRKLFYVAASSLVVAASVSGYALNATLFADSDSVPPAHIRQHTAPAPEVAAKAKAAALARFPGGTAGRVVQLADGSYAVRMTGGGPHHVFVNKDFQVTGAA